MNYFSDTNSNTYEDISLEDYDVVQEINTAHTNIVFCSRCNKQFIPKKNSKPKSASFYRCSECLSVKTIAKDFLYSCNIS